MIPAESFSLMLLHPPSAHAGSATATMMARWRMLIGICEASQSWAMDLHRALGGCVRFLPGVCLRAQPCFAASSLLLKKVKVVYLKVPRYSNTSQASFSEDCCRADRGSICNPLAAIPPIVAIDIVAGLRRHAAPVHG